MVHVDLSSPDKIAALAEGVRQRDMTARETLYHVVMKMLMHVFLQRPWTSEIAQDCAHDIWIATCEKLEANRLEYPEKLLGYIRMTAHYRLIEERRRGKQMPFAALRSEEISIADRRATANPESLATRREIAEQKAGFLRSVIESLLPLKHREILRRTILLKQDRLRILAEMHMTEGQFRNNQHRAMDTLLHNARRRALQQAA